MSQTNFRAIDFKKAAQVSQEVKPVRPVTARKKSVAPVTPVEEVKPAMAPKKAVKAVKPRSPKSVTPTK